jgi:DNA repair protein RadD
VPVKVSCPQCQHENDFWGVTTPEGEVLEHFGKKCQGAIESPDGGEILPCGFRYRYRSCERCGAENDHAAKRCHQCGNELVDTETRLREVSAFRDAHVMRPDSMTFARKIDKKGGERLEIRYYDLDGQYLSEIFFFENEQDTKVFFHNFIRMHHRLPGTKLEVSSIDEAIRAKERFRLPLYIVARKQEHYWRIREKIFP